MIVRIWRTIEQTNTNITEHLNFSEQRNITEHTNIRTVRIELYTRLLHVQITCNKYSVHVSSWYENDNHSRNNFQSVEFLAIVRVKIMQQGGFHNCL